MPTAGARGGVVVGLMSIARLSAGSGYRYLLRNIASGDVHRSAAEPLTAYYAASGYPPGRWLGSGLAGLGPDGLGAGAVVTEEAMARLYGAGQDPVTGAQLGRPYPVFRSVAERAADLVERLPDGLGDAERTERIAAIEERERARPQRVAVAGYDLTFTVPKSASVLWALGDPAVQQAVVDAHREAVEAVLGLIEERFLFTRVGRNSCAQVTAKGLIAAAFDHWDTRAGDPNLHTHVVIANKVQGPDGGWRSVDSLALHGAAVACSEIYDDLIADALANRLPVAWSYRDRGPRRTAAYEIDGIDDALLAKFSSRSSRIGEHVTDLIAGFRSGHGREPSRVEVLRLRQQATLATRPVKDTAPLSELIAGWRANASATTGQSPEQLVAAAMSAQRGLPAEVSAEQVAAAVEASLAAVAQRRSTWTRPNLLAEAARATRHLRTARPRQRMALLDAVTEAALARCLALDPPEMFQVPTRFIRPDGQSAFTRPEEAVFTTAAVLEAEARLLAAVEHLTGPRLPVGAIPAVASMDPTQRLRARLIGTRLTADQHAAVETIATSGRSLDVLVGPAGSGKTAALRVLAGQWAATYGVGSVVGLAPSATAAAQLAGSLGIACENTAKWIHHCTQPDSGDRQWNLTRDQLVIVDEAAMTSTPHLDTIVAQATTSGAKVLLVGDHHQLGAVEAGGAFALLAEAGHAVELEGLWRFRNRWEAEATRRLRLGDPAALGAYAERDRIHEGPAELMHEAAYAAWVGELAQGRSSVLIAADRATVAALNHRARSDRVSSGQVHPVGVPLHDGTTAGIGDLVVTRRNQRHLTRRDGRHVRNGDLWRVTTTHHDGSIDITPVEASTAGAETLRLPGHYVGRDVELGYATTVHRAQGLTVDTAHVIAAPGMDRQTLYVAMTRGREANHAWTITDRAHDDEHGTGPVSSGRQVLEGILSVDGAQKSATATLRERQDRACSIQRLAPIRETLLAAPDTAADRGDCIAAAEQVTRLMRLRAVMARADAAPRHPDDHRHPRPHHRPGPVRHDGVGR